MSTVTRTKKDVVTEFRTSGILEAARSVFAERGYSDATVDDIANAAGVAKGTVYLYYRSKKDIYFAALKFGIEQMYAALVSNCLAAIFIELELEHPARAIGKIVDWQTLHG